MSLQAFPSSSVPFSPSPSLSHRRNGERFPSSERRAPAEDPLQRSQTHEYEDSLNLYLTEIGRVSTLSAFEERSLFRRLERLRRWKSFLEETFRDEDVSSGEEKNTAPGNSTEVRGPSSRRMSRLDAAIEALRRRAIEANLRLSVAVAKKYQHRGLSLPDLVQEANLGLIRAVDRFDYQRGVRFGAYASWWIQQALGLAISTHARTIRVPAYLQEWQRKLAQAREQAAGKDAFSLQELAGDAGLSAEQARRALEADTEIVSFDMPLTPDTERTLGDVIEDVRAERPDAMVERAELATTVQSALETLDTRTVYVLRLRYGFEDGVGQSLQEVGETLSLSRERIRQIETAALTQLRHPAHARRLRALLPSA